MLFGVYAGIILSGLWSYGPPFPTRPRSEPIGRFLATHDAAVFQHLAAMLVLSGLTGAQPYTLEDVRSQHRHNKVIGIELQV